jgi:hypothetical protein
VLGIIWLFLTITIIIVEARLRRLHSDGICPPPNSPEPSRPGTPVDGTCPPPNSPEPSRPGTPTDGTCPPPNSPDLSRTGTPTI